jgi:hypothetical protein
MTLKEKIALRLKAKAAGVNLSKTRIDAIVARAEKGLTDESDDTAIDANLDVINELTPFKEIAALDDHQRARDKKIADDKEAKRLADIEAGKTPDVELPTDAPEWMKVFMTAQAAQTKALTDQIAAISGEKVLTTRKSRYEKALEKAPETFKANALEDFDLINFKDDEHFESWLTKKTEGLAATIQEDADGGLGGDRPAGSVIAPVGGKKEATAAEVDAVVDAIL